MSFAQDAEYARDVQQDPDRVLLLPAVRRINAVAKQALEGKIAESDAVVIAEKWTDAVLFDFGTDYLSLSPGKEEEE